MKVRVLMVGAGGIAGAHLRSLASLPDVEVVGVCDTNRRAASEAAKPTAANVYSSFQRMFDEIEAEAAYVCVPPYARGDIELAAIEAGLHLFVEKPVGLDLERAYAIADAVQRAGVVSAVGYHWRYSDLTQEARRYLADHPVHLLVGTCLGGMPATAWWRDKARSGGQVVEQATHVFDLVRHLCGEVRRVQAVALTGVLAGKVDGYSVEDASCATLELASGAIGTVTTADFLTVGSRVDLDLYGEAMLLRLRQRATRLELHEPGKVTHLDALEDARQRMDRAFIEAVRTGQSDGILCDYRDGAHTLALTLAVNHAMDTGKPALLSHFMRSP